MRIAGVSSAFPKNFYPQEVIREALKKKWAGKLDRPQVLDRFHESVGVKTRHLALPIPAYSELKTWGDANNAWIDCALDLGKQALCRALNQAGLSAADLGAIFFVSVTGIASPSIEGRLINRMGLSPNIKRIPIFGLGCVAGAAGIARAADYVKAYPKQAAALLSVELCSLTWREDDVSAANLISAGLFADGAASVIVAGNELSDHGPQVLATRSVFYPDTEDVMGWDISEKGFRIVLSRSVPDMVELHLAGDVDQFLGDHDLDRSDITSWIMHTGGPKVLEATEKALKLPPGALAPSWESLRESGNLSSASVLLVLEKFMNKERPAPGALSVLAAMGPGFCSELVLLQW
ncbi:MAG TPA: 3-oxoacyl-[acyl-carrier-protein] synthase III C-terminal domain-containing protein [Terriglobales bacterium]|nr:3-oxoacyl-[acyl-carrier-protein] synthase III C-terminal domain-containing protein [Terriglobales bacterium]